MVFEHAAADVTGTWVGSIGVNAAGGDPADLKAARRFAKRKLDELAADRQGLRKSVPAVAQRATVDEVLDDYEADCRLREAKSIVKMVSHTKSVRAALGAMRATDLTPERIDSYIAERLGAGKSKATVTRGLTILTTALKLARRRGKLVTAPEIRKSQETNVRRVLCKTSKGRSRVRASELGGGGIEEF